MATLEKSIRQSITLPSRLAKQVKALAKTRRTRANKVIVELVEAGLDAKEEEKHKFFRLADQLTHSTDAQETKRIKDELARMTFGE